MSSYELFEIVRIVDGEIITEYNDRTLAKDHAQRFANREGRRFQVVRKTVTTTKTVLGSFTPE
jgi:hypothetical protein